MDSTGTKTKDIEHIRPLAWLLNMMSHYRDMKAHGKQHLINYMWMHIDDENIQCAYPMFLMGMRGPFGNLFVDTVATLPYPVIDRPLKSIFPQPNGYDCGVCWCLFMYDTMLLFHNRPFVVGGGQDDAFFHLGEYIHSNAYVHEGEKY
jgi:hypothetical protein